MNNLLVTLPEYHTSQVKPRGFKDFCDMNEATLSPLGLWEFKIWDDYTGDVLQRIWTKNVITDNGATAMLKNTCLARGRTRDLPMSTQCAEPLIVGKLTITKD